MKNFLKYIANHTVFVFFAVLGITTSATLLYLASIGILDETLSSISLGV